MDRAGGMVLGSQGHAGISGQYFTLCREDWFGLLIFCYLIPGALDRIAEAVTELRTDGATETDELADARKAVDQIGNTDKQVDFAQVALAFMAEVNADPRRLGSDSSPSHKPCRQNGRNLAFSVPVAITV